MADRLRAAATAVLLALAVPFAATAQSEGAWIEGSWRGDGNVHGQASTARLDVAPALGGRFLEFGYSFVAGEATAFEGRGFYRRTESESWTGTWLDSGGAIHELRGAMGEGELVTHWGARGRTVYRLDGEGRLEIVDSVGSANGEWREFARHLLVRRSPVR